MEFIIVLGGVGLIALGMIAAAATRLVHVVKPDEIAIISGVAPDGRISADYSVITRGRFVQFPLLSNVERMSTKSFHTDIALRDLKSLDGETIHLDATAKIGFQFSDRGFRNSVELLMGRSQREIIDATYSILEYHLRHICGALTADQIEASEEKMRARALESAQLDMEELGLEVESLHIQSIDLAAADRQSV